MKTENYPIKIECFSIRGPLDNLEAAIKENIGYILVPVRNIPVLPSHKAFNQRPRWYKLIGVPKEWRHLKPEFMLNFVITDKDYLTVDKSLIGPHMDCGDSIVIDSNPSNSLLQSQDGIFIRLLEQEGVLQVGNIDTNCDIFLVKILLRNLKNLDYLMPETTTTSINNEIMINYDLLGNQYMCIPKRNFNRILSIREKIAIHFRSSLVTMQEYFEKIFQIPLEIYSNEKLVGTSKIRLGNLLKVTDLKEFLEKYEDSTFEIEGLADVVPTNSSKETVEKSLIEFKLSVKYLGTKKLQQSEKFQFGGNKNLAAGDAPESFPENNESLVEILSDSEVSVIVQEVSSKIQEVASRIPQKLSSKSDTTLLKTPRSPIKPTSSYQIEKTFLKSYSEKKEEISRIFSLNLQLKSIQFYIKPEIGVWQIGFHHPKADTPKHFVNQEILEFLDDSQANFEDFELKLYFSSKSREILDLIKLTDCALSVKGPHQTCGRATLDCKSLVLGIQQKISGLCLLENTKGEKLAIANIYVYLEDLGMNFNAPSNPTDLEDDEKPTCLMDESLAYKMVEELEEWKAKQKELFQESLKQKEVEYLEQLKRNFQRKTSVKEEELVEKLEKYSRLVAVLEEAQKSLEEKGIEYYLQEQAARKIRYDVEKNFADQLIFYRERIRRLESDFDHDKRLDELKRKEIESKTNLVENENCQLRETIRQLELQLAEARNNVPKEKFLELSEELVSDYFFSNISKMKNIL